MSGRVIVVGSVNIDLVARVPRLPRPGETVTGGSYEQHHGGKGGNQAVAAARLGRPTLFVGAIGDDSFAPEARRALAAERVDVSMLAELPGQPTGVALILVDEAGENEIAVVPGANAAIEAAVVRESLARLGRLHGDVLLVCNEIPNDVIRAALLAARAAGARTILNPAPATGLDRSVFGLADIISPNRGELMTLSQGDGVRAARRAEGETEIVARARALIEPKRGEPGVREAVIVTLGSEGVQVVAREQVVIAPPVAPAVPAQAGVPGAGTEGGGVPGAGQPAGEREGPVAAGSEATPAPTVEEVLRTFSRPASKVTAIDSTGAGDAFNGALAAALASGLPLEQAVRRAVASGGLATTKVGAREGMPTAAELQAFLAE